MPRSSSSALLPVLLLPLLVPACTTPSRDATAEREVWSRLQAAEHAARYNDPNEWVHGRPADDAVGEPVPSRLAMLPFPRTAFPAPAYHLTGREFHGMIAGQLKLAEKLVGSYAGFNRALDESTRKPDHKPWDNESDPLFVVVAKGASDLTNLNTSAISRSHPHHIFQGTFGGAAGEIDWIAIRMADGTELAVVNGRVFDLSQGNVILVRQHADGSVRLYQDLERLDEAATLAGVEAAVAKRLQLPEHVAFLAND